MRKSFENVYFVLLLAAYFLALLLRPVFSPLEVRCAEIAREMVGSGDYFVSQINSVMYKTGVFPGLQFSALLARFLGVSQFVFRLLSFASVSCCAWMVYYFFRTRKYSRLTAQFAVCLFLTMPAVFFAGTAILPDMFFVLLTVLSFGVLYSCAYEPHNKRFPAILVYLCSGVLAGFACCLKDISGLIIPLVAYMIFLITVKRNKELLFFPWIMLIESLMILLLWNLLDPHEKYVHFLSELTAVHTRFEFHFCTLNDVLSLLFGGMFWLPFFVVSCIGLGKKLWYDNTLRMSVIFLAVSLCRFFFFDPSPSTILFVVFPAAILTAAGFRSWLIRPWGRRYLFYGAGFLLLTDLLAVILLFIGFFADYSVLHIFYKDEAWLWMLAVVFFTFSMVNLVFLFYEKKSWQKVRCFLFALFPLMLLFVCVYPRSVLGRHAPAVLLDRLPPISKDTMIVTVSDLLPELCWGLKRQDIVLLDSGDPAAEWKRRSGNQKFGSVLLVLKKTDYEKGKRYGIFPDNAVWRKNWEREEPCTIVKYQYNMKDLKE